MLSARRLGAEQIIPIGRHPARTDLGREFGATDVVAARGAEGDEQVRDLTGGDGTHVVLEAVGAMPAYRQALGVVRQGGVISRVGVPQYDDAPNGMGSLSRHNAPGRRPGRLPGHGRPQKPQSPHQALICRSSPEAPATPEHHPRAKPLPSGRKETTPRGTILSPPGHPARPSPARGRHTAEGAR
ncbi:zinc-binding dehydrogenase [Nonomuraea sp. NPDC003560]|uniref:zinc-binding dehydrogenase n=1 Tax=Nonomuraea sp. NPDC003560 TaxID=3364341 RepID=UPI00367E908B